MMNRAKDKLSPSTASSSTRRRAQPLPFEVRLMHFDLISRLIGVHQLLLLNFYKDLLHYLRPSQEGPLALILASRTTLLVHHQLLGAHTRMHHTPRHGILLAARTPPFHPTARSHQVSVPAQ